MNGYLFLVWHFQLRFFKIVVTFFYKTIHKTLDKDSATFLLTTLNEYPSLLDPLNLQGQTL